MQRYLPYLLPVLLLSTMLMHQLGVLHIGCLQIKSHELKWTDLDYDYHPEPGDIFTTAEIVTSNNYEDGVLAILPNYDTLLTHDAAEISANRDRVDHIDAHTLSFTSDQYIVKACLEKEKTQYNDSIWAKTIVKLEVVGSFQVYEAESGDLLFSRDNEKFWIRNHIIFKGLAPKKLIENKVKEMYLAQMAERIPMIVEKYTLSTWRTESASTIKKKQTETEEALSQVTSIEWGTGDKE